MTEKQHTNYHRKMPDWHKKKISEAMKGIVHTPEWRQHQSEGLKRAWQRALPE